MTLSEFLEHVDSGRVPLNSPDCLMQRVDLLINFNLLAPLWNGRDFCIDRGMWGIIDMEWTKKLADWINGRTVIEIMSGRGWLTKALRLHNIDILATDNNGSHTEWRSNYTLVTDVLALEASTAIKKYGDDFDILLCSWPPMDWGITKAIRRWGTEKPIIYVGEGDGGCNATWTFWKWFNSESSQKIVIPQWYGMHDEVYIGHCKETI